MAAPGAKQSSSKTAWSVNADVPVEEPSTASTGAQLPCVRWTALHAGYFCLVSMTLNIFELELPMQTGR
jgi:hypothetical protein